MFHLPRATGRVGLTVSRIGLAVGLAGATFAAAAIPGTAQAGPAVAARLTNIPAATAVPALPTIAREFGTPISAVEHSLAAYFLGIAIGQAAIGPLSDRYGRRWPLLLGLLTELLGLSLHRLRRHLPSNIRVLAQDLLDVRDGCLHRHLVRQVNHVDHEARPHGDTHKGVHPHLVPIQIIQFLKILLEISNVHLGGLGQTVKL